MDDQIFCKSVLSRLAGLRAEAEKFKAGGESLMMFFGSGWRSTSATTTSTIR
jgi:hypothetical protein